VGTSASYTLERVSLVKRDAETLDGVEATWEPVTFGSSWNDGATVPAGSTLTSDPVSFNLVAGEDVFLTYWVTAEMGTVLRKIGSQTMAWTIVGSDESDTVDWQGLSITDTRSQIFAALRLDVLSSGMTTTTSSSSTTTVTTSTTSTTTLLIAVNTTTDAPEYLHVVATIELLDAESRFMAAGPWVVLAAEDKQTAKAFRRRNSKLATAHDG